MKLRVFRFSCGGLSRHIFPDTPLPGTSGGRFCTIISESYLRKIVQYRAERDGIGILGLDIGCLPRLANMIAQKYCTLSGVMRAKVLLCIRGHYSWWFFWWSGHARRVFCVKGVGTLGHIFFGMRLSAICGQITYPRIIFSIQRVNLWDAAWGVLFEVRCPLKFSAST